ncbi:DUF1707 domain-containing protein [Lipingzhangella sp. LS1_29]|uniref:DUF1707 domain-containing protein n=1 Tax=Lipingzhangella rawalii TaxID=2055835 RepID=A0ABU2H6B2_9ACTN|nr:DUF1707 domain-containing protein [Lipingzhangella rawalii]MDS1270854.1 DUF1707 domain-containing protein [Lipingzhangella rawalii]
MRASDTDRDETAARLATALGEGCLDLAEYERRLDLAMRARTRGELSPLTADLPEPREADSGNRELTPAWRDWVDEWRWWLGGAIIMTGIWGVTSISSQTLLPYWPFIPLGIWATILLAAAVWPDSRNSDRESS